ncbi:Oil body-associated protein 2A [Zea mays]|uniref:Oil body-associated protein 2A n=1 Tax=Zea mays TaxID=4577 RepID=A0A1D6NC78_MAIZE|nr:Oil body-associated protein 2A [Zea mays]
MASSDGKPLPTPASVGGGGGSSTAPPGQPTTVASKVLDMGAAAMQSLRPVKQAKQHMCTFALYAHDPKRQVETHLAGGPRRPPAAGRPRAHGVPAGRPRRSRAPRPGPEARRQVRPLHGGAPRR